MADDDAISAIYRAPSKRPPIDECMLKLEGKTLTEYRWTWLSKSTQSSSTTKVHRLRSPAAAQARRDALIAALEAEGWAPVSDWPKPLGGTRREAAEEQPAPEPKATSKQAKSKRAKPIKPVRLDALVLRGRARRASAEQIADLTKVARPPADWVSLVTQHGARTFAKRLRFTAPENVLARTKEWRTWATPDQRRSIWPSYDHFVPDVERLVLVANTIDGDQVGYVAGAKGFIILPRHRPDIIAIANLPALLGYYLVVAENADGEARPTYGPER